MKLVLGLATLCALQFSALAADTAYTALRAIGKHSGDQALNHVIEVRGRQGAPEPTVWKVTLDEPSARGGIREIEVQHGKIISEKTPLKGASGSPMNFGQLNLDSEGVFTLANEQAKKTSAPFDHVDYVLRGGGSKSAPVWHLELFHGSEGRVGMLDIAADSGEIVNRNWDKVASSAPSSRVANNDHAYLQDQPPTRPTHTPDRRDDSSTKTPDWAQPEARRDYDSHDARDSRDYDRHDYDRNDSDRRDYDRRKSDRRDYDDDDYDGPGFIERMANHFKKRGRQFENFFSGRGWTAQ